MVLNTTEGTHPSECSGNRLDIDGCPLVYSELPTNIVRFLDVSGELEGVCHRAVIIDGFHCPRILGRITKMFYDLFREPIKY